MTFNDSRALDVIDDFCDSHWTFGAGLGCLRLRIERDEEFSTEIYAARFVLGIRLMEDGIDPMVSETKNVNRVLPQLRGQISVEWEIVDGT